MENNISYAKWKGQLMKLNLVIILALSVLEFGLYFGIRQAGKMYVGFDVYLVKYIIVPLLINMGSWLLCHSLLKREKISQRNRNFIILFSSLMICVCIACVHNDFVVVICFFSLVIIISSLFGDILLTKMITGLSLGGMAVSSLYAGFHEKSGDVDYLFEVAVTMAFLIFTYLFTRIIIEYNNEQLKRLSQTYHRLERLEHRILLDPLTGLYNHTAFYTILNNQLEECRESGQAVTLAVIDIDDFKKINDHFGHENGNLVLIRLSSLLQTYCGPEGYACRYGGEEFTVIFPGIKKEKARELMEKIRMEFSCSSYPFLHGEKVTFSCGIFECTDMAVHPQEIFQKADDVMYQAKDLGKNQCKMK